MPSSAKAKSGVNPPGTAQTRLERPMLLRSLKLLETVAAAGRGLSLADLATSLEVPKPTIFRLAQRLEEGGYLAREPGSRGGFTIGPRLLRLSLDTVRTSGTNPQRRAILQALGAALGETCNLSALAGSEVLYLDLVEAGGPLRVHLEPGLRVPLHCTAGGKLFLAHMPPTRRRRLLDNLELAPHTPATLTSKERLEEECAQILREGYSLDREEFLVGLIAVAVPVKNASGTVVAALTCHAPSARFSLAQALGSVTQMQEAARKLGASLPD